MIKRGKKTLLWFVKAAAAGCTALAILCLMCVLYFNLPVHYANPSGATDYYWEKNRFYSRATEGFACGRTNNEGFNNLFDHNEGDKIDILLMGTSHMEAFNVRQDENTAAVLNRLYGGERTVYNIGTAGHTLMRNINNLDNALEYYKPQDYAVIECNLVSASNAELEALINNEYPVTPSYNGGLVTMLQKLPYLRLFYTKYVKGMNNAGEDAANAEAEKTDDPEENRRLLNSALAMAADSAEKHGIKLMIVFDTTIYMDENKHCYTGVDGEKLDTMKKLCADNGIEFIDAAETMLKAAEENERLPYGFANTKPGEGHLNRWGHELLAGCIYDRIRETEG